MSLHRLSSIYFFFFFNDTATTEIYTLSLHDALPISGAGNRRAGGIPRAAGEWRDGGPAIRVGRRLAADRTLPRVSRQRGHRRAPRRKFWGTGGLLGTQPLAAGRCDYCDHRDWNPAALRRGQDRTIPATGRSARGRLRSVQGTASQSDYVRGSVPQRRSDLP